MKPNKKTTRLAIIFGMSSLIFLNACTKEEANNLPGTYGSGVFISNEGKFMDGTGTISYFNPEKNQVFNNIFELANGRPLGNVVQSIEVINEWAFVVVNNADKIEVANHRDFRSLQTIKGFSKPRYIIEATDSKAYVSEWGGQEGGVKVLDLNTLSIKNFIKTGNGAEKMLKVNNKVYVANSGGFGYDTTVAVINVNTDKLEQSIAVGYNPNSIQQDANGNIWVLCSGKWKSDYSGLEHPGSLVRINANTQKVDLKLNFNSSFSQPKSLEIDNTKQTLYYIYNNKVFTHNINSTELNNTPLVNRGFYAIGIDKNRNNMLYGADAKNFSSNGWIIRYNKDGGSPVDSFQVGIIPGGFYFK